MRFCKETKNIIHSTYFSATLEEIQQALMGRGLRPRSISSLKKYVDKLKSKVDERTSKELDRYLKNPVLYRARTLVSGAKQRAKKKNIPFNLTVDWVYNKIISGKCEATGIDFYIKPYVPKHIKNYTPVHPHSPSLDQISPSGGYTMDNVQIVCDQFNKFKNDKSMEETVFVAKKFVEYYETVRLNVVEEILIV